MMLTLQPRDKAFKFIAFVSYSHHDSRWARWLQKGIETYRLPRRVAAGGDRRAGRVFLDRSELATSTDLSMRIQEAMDESANLLVLCSPAARRSRWVNEEIRRFREAGKGDRIFCLIVGGDPASSSDDGCFPPSLVAPFVEDGSPVEPLAADIRPGNDRPRDARLKLIAGLLDLPFDTLKRRDQLRRQRLLLAITVVSLFLLAAMTALAVTAVLSRNEAVVQRDTAQRTVSFLSDLFDGARPEGAAGREVGVRELVDRAAIAAVASSDLRQQPEVRAALLTTLANVYAKLRLPTSGRKLTLEADRYGIRDKQTALYHVTVTANLMTIAGDYPQLERLIDKGTALIGNDKQLQAAFGAQLLMARAQLDQHENRPLDAERSYLKARQIALRARPPRLETAANALLGAATADVDSDQVGRAETRLHRVIRERQVLGETLHPDVLTAYNSLGAIAIKRGDPVTAERWFRRAMVLQIKVFGPASLDVALSRSNLGRALVEQRRFTAARGALLAARTVYLREVGPKADVLANLEDSLGLALSGLGQTNAAEAAFMRGLVAARANGMAKEVELLTDRAELLCATRQTSVALALLAEARRGLAEFHLSEPWRAARIDMVEGRCLLDVDRKDDAARLLARSTHLVLQRWGGASLFGRTASANLHMAGR